MNHFDDALQLVAHAEGEFDRIKSEYSASLEEKVVKTPLLIAIKNLVENLRSALDYAANGLFSKYGSSHLAKPKIYFPYSQLGQSGQDFRKQNSIERSIPGISSSRPDIVSLLESFQSFANPSNEWLPVFMDLTNKNKHQLLTPQTKIETTQLKLSSGGTQITMNPGTSISMGLGTSIQMGGMTIPGGQRFDSDNPPRAFGKGSIETVRWVSFQFSHNGVEVLSHLDNAVRGVRLIVTDLSIK